MDNTQTQQAWSYHDQTKHTPASVRNSAHFLDWSNQPLAFKIYSGVEPLPLPLEIRQTAAPALSAIAAGTGPVRETVPDLEQLTHLLYFTAGITRRRRYPGGEILFRAASCTGALYEIEVYLACANLPELPAGLYHFNPGDLALRLLRSGDWRGALVEASGGEPAVAGAPVILIATGTYWRNAWKYQARTYRHFGWDNGTMYANLLGMAAALSLPARVVCGFVDREVNALLGLDAHREVALTLVPLGFHNTPAPPAPPLGPLQLASMPLSKEEVDYPAMRNMHEASSLASPAEVRDWRGADVPPAGFALSEDAGLPGQSLEEVILRRGSSRRFRPEAIPADQFSRMLDCATRGIPADFHHSFGTLLNEIYLIVHAVEGLEPGAYYYRPPAAFELLRKGDFRQAAAHLALDQELAGNAAANIYFLAALEPVLHRLGNRGYRAAQLEAGILGGKIYLAAYGQGLGATGLTFYDDEVSRFFSPHAAGKSTIFLVAVGRSGGRDQ